jgi:hypothetical protein
MMKLFGRLLVVLGIAALIPAAATAYQHFSAAKKHDAKIEELLAKRDTVRTELTEVSLRLRGYQQSIPSMPDSLKKAQSGIISQTFREFNKNVRRLERDEAELTRLVGRERTRKDEALSGTWRLSGSLAGVAVLLVVGGIAMTRRASGFRG